MGVRLYERKYTYIHSIWISVHLSHALFLMPIYQPMIWRIYAKKSGEMIFKFIFKCLSESRKINYVKANGILLGTRMRNNRKVFIYMVKDFFVELIHKNDNNNEAEYLNTFTSLRGLNAYLENEFKAAAF